MAKHKISLLLLLALCIWLPSGAVPAADDPANLTGQWYGTMHNYIATTIVQVFIDQDNNYVIVHDPGDGLLYQPLPATFGEDSITIWAGDYIFAGTVTGDSISGVVWHDGSVIIEWQLFREIDELLPPGPGPGPSCDDLPPPFCIGDAEYCTELVLFDPAVGSGYIDYPRLEETWDDQCYSYIRRDAMRLVKYAAAKVECKTADWEYWDFAPVFLGNMSEADGSTPGTSVGTPYHLTHKNGNDIDIAYYQLYATDNRIRTVGEHFEGYTNVKHCVGEPYALDPWRTALFIAYLSEHPHLSHVLVDGQVGLALEEALDDLEAFGWIDSGQRARIPLLYEAVDDTVSWYYFHHDHMHVAMRLLHPIVSDVELKPDTLNKSSQGKYVTGYIELVEGYDAADIYYPGVGLIVNGHTILYSEPGLTELSDFNDNGVVDLTVKFDRKAVAEAVGTGTVEVAITGDVNWKFFQASDTIRVLSR